jgi:hypothetical protein
MITEQTATDRVTRGMALFTRAELDRIDLADLDIADPFQCVVGQIFGSYYSVPANSEMGRRGVLLDSPESLAAGLDCHDHEEAELLTNEWIRQIRVQRGVDLRAGEPVSM